MVGGRGGAGPAFLKKYRVHHRPASASIQIPQAPVDVFCPDPPNPICPLSCYAFPKSVVPLEQPCPSCRQYTWIVAIRLQLPAIHVLLRYMHPMSLMFVSIAVWHSHAHDRLVH